MRGNTPLAVLQREIVGSYETRQNQEQSIFPFIDIFLKKIKIFFHSLWKLFFYFALNAAVPSLATCLRSSSPREIPSRRRAAGCRSGIGAGT